MSNIQIKLNDFMYLSLYQNQDISTGVAEVWPFSYSTNKPVGEPVVFATAGELVAIMQGCIEGDFMVFENQYTFTFEEHDNDN